MHLELCYLIKKVGKNTNHRQKACNLSSGISARISFTFMMQKSKKATTSFLFIHHIISYLYSIPNTCGILRV